MNFRQLIFDHVQAKKYLSAPIIKEILASHPDLVYQGVAYRSLMLENNRSFIGEDDICFTKSLDSSLKFVETNDPNKRFIHIYRANVLGLDIAKALDFFKLDNEFPHEEEVCVMRIIDSSIILKSPADRFDFWYSKIS